MRRRGPPRGARCDPCAASSARGSRPWPPPSWSCGSSSRPPSTSRTRRWTSWRDGAAAERTSGLLEQLEGLLDSARRGVRLRSGLTVALAGRPNAGKSTLFNRLLREDRAIVTDRPGTTRDLLRETLDVSGIACELIDTAGLRETDDPIEAEGVRRAREAAAAADLVLVVAEAGMLRKEGAPPTDDGFAFEPEVSFPALNDLLAPERVLVVANKWDLLDAGAPPAPFRAGPWTLVPLCARSGAGLEALLDALLETGGLVAGEEPPFTARERHVVALEEARTALARGLRTLRGSGSGELLAEDLRIAHDALGRITGRVTPDALLGEIFGRFCIGK
jgi:tRNA modification GTPase